MRHMPLLQYCGERIRCDLLVWFKMFSLQLIQRNWAHLIVIEMNPRQWSCSSSSALSESKGDCLVLLIAKSGIKGTGACSVILYPRMRLLNDKVTVMRICTTSASFKNTQAIRLCWFTINSKICKFEKISTGWTSRVNYAENGKSHEGDSYGKIVIGLLRSHFQ